MTAAEWKAYFRDSRPGVAASLDVTDVLRDLAGCEAERDLEKLNGDVISTIREELHERYGEECTFFDDAVHHVLAKLEAERDALLKAEKEMWSKDFRDVQKERDDLRRKLEEAEHDRDEWRKQAGIQLTGTASLALANAALRKALESLRPVVYEPYEWEPDPVAYAKAIDAALAAAGEPPKEGN